MEVWYKTETSVEYMPTKDGSFEAWMDKHDPGWRLSNSMTIQFWREIWSAGVKHGRQEAN